jgi:hypothetical protein
MRRLIACLFVGVLTLSMAPADENPGGSKAYGKPLGEWMKLYWTWFIGGDQEGQVKKVVFLPLPAGTDEDGDGIAVGELDVTLQVGQKFVLPMFVYVGETYVEDVPADDPSFPPDEVFTGATVVIKLDGKVIIDSEDDDLSEFFFDAQFFDEPIEYPEPSPRGPDLTADAAIWVKGIGFVHPPLSPGEHTLELFVYSPDFGFGFQNTWNIEVVKKK